MSNSLKHLCIVFALAELSACAPLHFDIYVRNMVNDTTSLTLIYKTDQPDKTKNTVVRYKDSVLDINSKTREKLNEVLSVRTTGDRKKLLILPPRSTVYLSDLIYPGYAFTDNILIFKNAVTTDSLRFNYPYRRIKGFKHKRNSLLNFFYRTILYYDVKQ
ncbi:MAG TPA: hypothetical protein VKR53_05430 [Puia sp.]|nr:hypothetical protein [Puia sp.]